MIIVYDCSCYCSKFILCRLGQACNHIATLLFFIDYYANINAENLPPDLSKTSKPMAWNQPPKKTVTPECSSNMQFIKPSHGDLPLQKRISRSTFDPHCVKHRGDVNQEKLGLRVRQSMPHSGLQHFWCDGPNLETLPDDASLWSHVLFSNGSLNFAIKKVNNSTSIDCQQYLSSMKLSSSEVEVIEAATRQQSASELWQAMRNGHLTSSRFREILKRRPTTSGQGHHGL